MFYSVPRTLCICLHAQRDHFSIYAADRVANDDLILAACDIDADNAFYFGNAVFLRNALVFEHETKSGHAMRDRGYILLATDRRQHLFGDLFIIRHGDASLYFSLMIKMIKNSVGRASAAGFHRNKKPSAAMDGMRKKHVGPLPRKVMLKSLMTTLPGCKFD